MNVTTTAEVLAGRARWAVEQADVLAFLDALPADCLDLVFFSPPYEKARTYGISFDLAGQAWVDWLVRVFQSSLRVCNGLVGCVCEGQTKNYRWSAVPALLMADLHRAGVNLRKPPIYRRIGIPGSGGPDWLRNDYEFIVCAARPGKLPWSDNTACGHPPKWAPGGEMSHRLSDGSRVNQWGKAGTESVNGHAGRNADGRRQKAKRPGHVMTSKKKLREGIEPKVQRFLDGDMPLGSKLTTKATADDARVQCYVPPALANPGNVIDLKVGGGLMGSPLCHENEAPFPEALAKVFVLSFCPPMVCHKCGTAVHLPKSVCVGCGTDLTLPGATRPGLVCDPFSGSGTTGAVAARHGRRFVGCDLRQSQVDISRRRISAETPDMFAELAP